VPNILTAFFGGHHFTEIIRLTLHGLLLLAQHCFASCIILYAPGRHHPS
jgi:hypothetical protein